MRDGLYIIPGVIWKLKFEKVKIVTFFRFSSIMTWSRIVNEGVVKGVWWLSVSMVS